MSRITFAEIGWLVFLVCAGLWLCFWSFGKAVERQDGGILWAAPSLIGAFAAAYGLLPLLMLIP